jgi:hypothetical protein
MEPLGLFAHSKVAATYPYPEPEQSRPCVPLPLLEKSSEIICT